MTGTHQQGEPLCPSQDAPDPEGWSLPPMTLGELSLMLRMHSRVLQWKVQQLLAKSEQLHARGRALHRRVDALLQTRC